MMQVLSEGSTLTGTWELGAVGHTKERHTGGVDRPEFCQIFLVVILAQLMRLFQNLPLTALDLLGITVQNPYPLVFLSAVKYLYTCLV